MASSEIGATFSPTDLTSSPKVSAQRLTKVLMRALSEASSPAAENTDSAMQQASEKPTRPHVSLSKCTYHS